MFKRKKEKVVHEIAPVYDENSAVLVLGTMPSPLSRETGFYYGNPNNRFWRVLAAVFGEETPASAAERAAFLLRNRVALWDVCASCEIEGAADASICEVIPNDVGGLIAKLNIRRVFFNGAKAEELFERYITPPEGVTFTRLPSTSPANASWDLPRLAEAWRVIKPSPEGKVSRRTKPFETDEVSPTRRSVRRWRTHNLPEGQS